MKPITYSSHLNFRLEFRNIPRILPKKIVQISTERYFDTITGKNIAVAEIEFQNKIRDMAVTYDENANEIVLITIHPLKSMQKINRINSGRWKKI